MKRCANVPVLFFGLIDAPFTTSHPFSIEAHQSELRQTTGLTAGIFSVPKCEQIAAKCTKADIFVCFLTCDLLVVQHTIWRTRSGLITSTWDS